MKQLILTGLATEQSFGSSGEASYYLVFNNGELRVPVSESAAEIVVKEMVANSSHLPETDDPDSYNALPEDGSYATAYTPGSDDPEGDGVNQI